MDKNFFKRFNKDNKNLSPEQNDKVVTLREQRNALQEQIYVIQRQIDDIYIANMNPHFKKGDYIKFVVNDSHVVYSLLTAEPNRLNMGVKIKGPEISIWYSDKDIITVHYYDDNESMVSTYDFNKVTVISEDEFNKTIDDAFDCLRTKIALTKEEL